MSLNLSSNQLSASLSLIGSPDLKELNLSHNPLNEILPADFFSKHPLLESIVITNAELQGIIPVLSAQLKEITLSYNQLH